MWRDPFVFFFWHIGGRWILRIDNLSRSDHRLIPSAAAQICFCIHRYVYRWLIDLLYKCYLTISKLRKMTPRPSLLGPLYHTPLVVRLLLLVLCCWCADDGNDAIVEFYMMWFVWCYSSCWWRSTYLTALYWSLLSLCKSPPAISSWAHRGLQMA